MRVNKMLVCDHCRSLTKKAENVSLFLSKNERGRSVTHHPVFQPADLPVLDLCDDCLKILKMDLANRWKEHKGETNDGK